MRSMWTREVGTSWAVQKSKNPCYSQSLMSDEIGKTHGQVFLKTLPTYYKTLISRGFQFAERKIANLATFPPDPPTHRFRKWISCRSKITSSVDGIVCQISVGKKKVPLSLYQTGCVGSHINVRMTQLLVVCIPFHLLWYDYLLRIKKFFQTRS